jgi:TrmH family RNA methyltransferase
MAQAKGVSIPIDPRVESLNVSTAAAICLFETVRIRRN